MCLTVCAFCALDSLQVSSPTSKRRSWPCLCRQRNLSPLQCIRQRGLTGLLPLMNPLLAKEDPEALEYVGVVENLRVEAGQTHTAAGPSSRRRPLRHALIRVIIKQVAISLAQGLQVVVRRRFQLPLMNERRVVGPLLRPPRRTSAYRLDRQWLLEIIVSLRTWAVYLTCGGRCSYSQASECAGTRRRRIDQGVFHSCVCTGQDQHVFCREGTHRCLHSTTNVACGAGWGATTRLCTQQQRCIDA